MFTITIQVRGYEIDSLGHVNNAVFLAYLEHSRWEMFGPKGPLPALPPGVQVVVRHLELDYMSELLLGDTVRVTQWPRKVGTTSVTLGAAIQIVEAGNAERRGRLSLLATQVITCVEVGGGKTPVPDSWRALVPAEDPGPKPAFLDT